MTMERLLVIDDEPDIGSFIKTVAESCGYEVTITSDSESFKKEYSSLRPDVVALDLAIPNTDGIELLRFLAEEGCDARVLIISGFDQRVLESAWRLGSARGLRMAGMITKPARVADLRSLLNNLRKVA